MICILTSFFVVLNIFRKEIQSGKNFFKKIKQIEDPMIRLKTARTIFSRIPLGVDNLKEEKELLERYTDFQNSYEIEPMSEYTVDAERIYKHINISFWLLAIGSVISILSIINFC